MQICNKNAPINNIGYRLGHNLHEWCLLSTSVLCILSPYTSLQIQHFKLITVFCMILRLHNLLASEVNNTITLYINLCWAGSHLISADSPPRVPTVICPLEGSFSTSPGISQNLANQHIHIFLPDHAITFRTPNSSLTLSLLENLKCVKVYI